MVERKEVTTKTRNVCINCKRRKSASGGNAATGWILNIGSCKCGEEFCAESSNETTETSTRFSATVSGDSQPGAETQRSDSEPSTIPQDEIPKFIDDRFEVLSVLGKGGMGTVYKVRDQQVGNIFALKLLHQNLQSDPSVLKRFEQEAKAAEQLDHPNLVPTYAHGITKNGEPYLLIEYVEGETLAQIIEREGALEDDRAISIFEQICAALSYAHEMKIVHRDIKPANIIVSKTPSGEEVVRVVDFGIAKTLTEVDRSTRNLTQTGEVFGSPHYMSPEQCLGLMLDEKSDIYSLGCVMFEALSGKPPFAGSNPIQLVVKHINDKPKPYLSKFSKSRKAFGLQAVALKCLEKEAVDRFQDMGEIEHAFSRLKSGKSINFDQNSKFKTSIFQKQLHITAFVIPLLLIAVVVFALLMSSIEVTHKPGADNYLSDLVVFISTMCAVPLIFVAMFGTYARSCFRIAKDNIATKKHWWTSFSLTFSSLMGIGLLPLFFYFGYGAFWSKWRDAGTSATNLTGLDLPILGGILLFVASALGVVVCTGGFLVDTDLKKISLKKMVLRSLTPITTINVVALVITGCFAQPVALRAAKIYSNMPYQLCSNLRTKAIYVARQIAPSDLNSLDNSATESLRKKNYQGTIADLTEILRLETAKVPPNRVRICSFLYRRANAYKAWRKFDEAIQDWTTIITEHLDDEDDYYYFRMRGDCYVSALNYGQAIHDYSESIVRNRDDFLSYYKRANAQVALHDFDGAIQSLNQRASLPDGERPALFLMRGYIYGLDGKSLKAKEELIKATLSKPRQESCWDDVGRSLAFLMLGNKSEAKLCFESAKKKDLDAREFFEADFPYTPELREKLVQFVSDQGLLSPSHEQRVNYYRRFYQH